MTANYTKGEWNIWIHPDRIPPEGEGFWAIYVADEQGKAIARVSRDNTDEMMANARLITATPDMYEMLKEIWAMTATKCHDSYIKSINDLCGKTLAKAEGRNA